MHFALLLLVLVPGAQPLVAVTYYVTHSPTLLCTNNKSDYSIFITIQDAVNQVPAGSTINVCPGTYAEQVVISQPLTLRGVSYNNSSGNSSQAVIAMPDTGLTTTTSINFGTVAAQVQVTAGPVKLSNITVDGTPLVSTCPGNVTFAIYYSSGSSGTVSEVGVRNQKCDGIGIGAENGSGATESVAIESNNISPGAYMGIFACSEESPSTLTVSIKSNYVGDGEFGIVPYCNVAGSVSSNVVSWAGTGIYAGSPSTTVSGNTVMGLAGEIGIEVDGGTEISDNTINGGDYGVYLVLGGTITSNHISNGGYGILFGAGSGGSTVKSNIITQAGVGIEFDCISTNTVSGNTINGATTGLDFVPASFTGVNTLYNVAAATTGGCSSGAARRPEGIKPPLLGPNGRVTQR
jgi:hypothetical protein